MFLIDCMKYNKGSLEQALNYDLINAIFCLSSKCDVCFALNASQKFFSSSEITAALKFLYLTSTRINSLSQEEEQMTLN